MQLISHDKCDGLKMIFLKIPQLFSMIFSIKSKILYKACKVFMFCLPLPVAPPITPPRPSLQSYTATMKFLFLKYHHLPLPWQFPLIFQYLIYVSLLWLGSHCFILSKHLLYHSYSVFLHSQLGWGLLEKVILFHLCIPLWSKHSVWFLISAQ